MGIAEQTTALPSQPQSLPVTATLQKEGKNIQLEVARTQEELATGLMLRDSLPSDRGMLFEIDPPEAVQFWMKSVQFPLDMIFIQNGNIVAIAENVQPCKTEPCPLYGPPEIKVDQVVELKGGVARQLKLKVGNRVTLSPINPK